VLRSLYFFRAFLYHDHSITSSITLSITLKNDKIEYQQIELSKLIMTNINTWIIGCGNTGQLVTQRLQQQGLHIKATSHSGGSTIQLEQLGIEVFPADLDDPSSLRDLTLDHADIFYFAPPAAKDEKDHRMSSFLASLNLSAPPRRIVYISTTGVYGDHDGAWITEKTPTKPNNARSKRRLDAENQIRDFCGNHVTEYMILRVAGIYDSKKLPLDRINAGLKVLKADIAPSSNRIHGDDLANICIAAMQSKHHDEIFNIADGNPSSISDYFIQTAHLFNLTPPEEIDWEQAQKVLSPEMLSYLKESKKIDASYVLDRLGVSLLYPSLTEGLMACKNEREKL